MSVVEIVGSSAQPWDGSKYLTQISGKDYLEVKWRLVGLRHDHPDAQLQTELVKDSGDAATFKCVILVPSTGAMGQGHGTETYQDFHDYVEKAETKAIGRALATLGYGTQFCDDFEAGVSQSTGEKRIVDAPVQRRQAPAQARPATTSRDQGFRTQSKGADDKATDDQLKVIRAILLATGEFGQRGQTNWQAFNDYTGDIRELTYGEAQTAIENLRHYEGERKANPGRKLGIWDEYIGAMAAPNREADLDADPWDGETGEEDQPL